MISIQAKPVKPGVINLTVGTKPIAITNSTLLVYMFTIQNNSSTNVYVGDSTYQTILVPPNGSVSFGYTYCHAYDLSKFYVRSDSDNTTINIIYVGD